MSKIKICKLIKNEVYSNNPEIYQAYVYKAKFFCMKCGAVSNKKSYICKEFKIKKQNKKSDY